MKSPLQLEALKSLLQERAPVRVRRDLGMLPGSSPSIPLRAGQMIELLGEGRWAWCIRFLKERKSARAAWLSMDSSGLFPMAMAQEEIALSRVLFLERVPMVEGVEVLLAVLRSQLFEVVMMDQGLLPRIRQDVQVRKIQLTAEEAGSMVLLLSDRPTNSFGVSIRVETGMGNEVRLEKVKGGTE